ncbi:DapH/DapD/GlmU-related protein [uncultured Murdochiella sp.]|uniref:DapH/DapD/GlmU-related protein n=1 Tax=uncultured Murdochiella sp. TaxID=1586095 RepID=UPI002804B16F|nr:DapH/DapD/GlmU-related protein [uncultured Murdochiella sp.]
MPSILILPSSFLNAHRAEEKQTWILGHPIRELVERAAASPSWTVLQDGLNTCSEELLVVSEAAAGLDEAMLYRFYSDEQRLLTDYDGMPAAIKVQEKERALLCDAFSADFDAFFDAWTDVVTPDEADSVVEELFLDIPVVHSFLTLQLAEKHLAQQICYDWMEKGVRIDEPTLTRIAPEAVIGKGTWLRGTVRIMGETVIGERCVITEGSEIIDSTIEEEVTIRSSIIEESVMKKASNIGPFSHLRPHAFIGEHVHIGNFVEVKKASLGEGTKAGHLAYIGDAEVGKNVNISCGVIFCNYDGKNKHKATVGDNAFIGSNANLVAPVELQEDSFIAAGSTITKTVDKGALAVERAEQRSIAGYVARRREKGLL